MWRSEESNFFLYHEGPRQAPAEPSWQPQFFLTKDLKVSASTVASEDSFQSLVRPQHVRHGCKHSVG